MLGKLLTFFLILFIPSSQIRSEEIKLNTAEGMAKIMRKIQCSLIDNKPITYWWYGNAYGRRMGMPDKKLFGIEGMNIRTCVTVNNNNGEYGYRLVSREILLYKDINSGEILRTWKNPYTNEEVEVFHVANDPVNQPPSFGVDRSGNPMKFPGTMMDERWWFTATIPLYYSNSLGGDYQKYVGGVYRATEMFNYFGDIKSLTDSDIDTANTQVGWVRHSDWLPWMRMEGRDGIIYMHSAGKKLNDFKDIPEAFKKEISEKYPKYTTPPPVDDNRPNETSWTYFKRVINEKGGPEKIKRQ